MQYIDFSKSHTLLCNLAKAILADSDTIGFEKDTSPDFYTEGNKLYINLGLLQGWVVVDTAKNSVHHVSDIEDPLTSKNICNNYLAQLLYQDISDLLIMIEEELSSNSQHFEGFMGKNDLPL